MCFDLFVIQHVLHLFVGENFLSFTKLEGLQQVKKVLRLLLVRPKSEIKVPRAVTMSWHYKEALAGQWHKNDPKTFKGVKFYI